MNTFGVFICLIVIMAFSVLAFLYKPIDMLANDVLEIIDLIHKKNVYDKKIKQRHNLIKQQFNEDIKKIAA